MLISSFIRINNSKSFPPKITCSRCYSYYKISDMGHQKSPLISHKSPNFRFCNISGKKTELVEIHATDPRLHLLFIPGNPGVISFYNDFLESLYEQMGETASITGIGHISHSEKDWENGKLFSLQEQIDHKINFIKQELQALEVPLIVVSHSIGSYMSLEIVKRIPEKVAYFIALYPFMAVNTESQQQSIIKKISRISNVTRGGKFDPSTYEWFDMCCVLSYTGQIKKRERVKWVKHIKWAASFPKSQLTSRVISATVALFGMLPFHASRFIAKNSLAKSWSTTAIDALCTSVLKYHTMRNVLYLAMTEFEELVKVPDWDFIRKNRDRIAFLYGDDDHWAPLHMHDEIVKQVPDALTEIEREGHTHSFCCTVAGSVWVARHVATLINKTIFRY